MIHFMFKMCKLHFTFANRLAFFWLFVACYYFETYQSEFLNINDKATDTLAQRRIVR